MPGRTKSVIARAIATAGGAGYAPIAPGTCGTAVAVPLAYVAAGLPGWAFALVIAGTTLLGIWAASVSDQHWGTHDSGRIVIDEVAGYFMTVVAIDRSDWMLLILAFVVFRVLDITKPPPVRAIDRRMPGGAGVVLDDVAAGVYGALVMWGLVELGISAWLGSIVL